MEHCFDLPCCFTAELRAKAVEEQDVREPSPDVMINGQAQPLEPPQESQVAPDVQASEAVAGSLIVCLTISACEHCCIWTLDG